eukprot:4412-Heterococcus_DN1.PRE.3
MTKVVATEVNRAVLSHSIFTSRSLIDAVASHAAQYRLLKDTLLVHQQRSACLTTQSCLLARAAALQILLLAGMVFTTNTICLTNAGLSLDWKLLYAHFKQTYCSNYHRHPCRTAMITYVLYLTALWFTEGTPATTYVVPNAVLNMPISPSHKACPRRLAATAYASSMTSTATAMQPELLLVSSAAQKA